jgi:predicted permease
VNVIVARLAAQYPATDKGISLRVLPERLSRPLPQAAAVIPALVSLFLVLAALVLLIACINVANISLVRAMVRRREMAVRVALGAGRSRLIRQMLTESLLLAAMGGAVGMVLGMWTSRLISSLDLQTSLPVFLDFHFDWSVFAYAMGVTVVTGLIVGLWPALRASSANVSMVLHEAGRSESAGLERHRMRSILVVAQVAGSLLLLVVAALFVRSLQQAQRTYLGFDPDHLLNVTLDPNEIGYDQQHTNDFYRDLKARVLMLPGVKSATVAFDIPMGNFNDGAPVFVEGHAQIPGEQPPQIMLNRIDADYFNTLRVPLLEGREFTANDNEKAPLVAIINQTMAKQFWPNQSPIGKRFSVKGPTGPFIEVAGVAGDGRYSFIFESPQPHFYVPMAQNLSSLRILQIRTSVQPESLMTPVQQEVRALDPGMPIVDLRTMRQSLQGANGFFILRLGALLAGATGVLGLVLAVVGVYGVLSFVTARRTREIGIRMALGAAQSDVLRMVLRQGIVIVSAGSIIGLGLAFAAGRAANSFLMVSGADPLTFAVVPTLLAAVALWACYIPARRATKVDPMVALRYE